MLLLKVEALNAQSLPTNSVLTLNKKVADWQLNEWKTQGMRWPKWDWENAVCYTGLFAIYEATKDKKYLDALYEIGKSINWKNGPNRSYADEYCVAQLYCQLYTIYKDKAMLSDFESLINRLIEVPHVESLEWANKNFLREWSWCDALFMGPPSFAFYAKVTGQTKYLDFANSYWWNTTQYLFDTSENLYFRDSRFFKLREKNGEKIFWSRGNGWVFSALCRMIDNMPIDYKDYEKYVSLYKKMALRIGNLQHLDGSWHSALLDTIHYKQPEASGTSFMCYALAWGINKKILDYDEYYPKVSKAWVALEKMVHDDGKLGYVQPIGASPDKVSFNDTEVYGVGAFLLAGSEMIKLEGNCTKDRQRTLSK